MPPDGAEFYFGLEFYKDVASDGAGASRPVRHSSAPRTGATCKRNLRQLDFEIFVPAIIFDRNSQFYFHKAMLTKPTTEQLQQSIHVICKVIGQMPCFHLYDEYVAHRSSTTESEIALRASPTNNAP